VIRRWLESLHPRYTLRGQLIATITGVHMLLMVSFVYDLVDRQQHFLHERARARSLYQAQVLAASSVPQLITRDFAGLKEIFESVSRDKGIRFASLSLEDGRIIADSDPRIVMTAVSEARRRAVSPTDPKPVVVAESAGAIEAAAPVMVDHHLLGWAWVAADLADDRAQILGLRKTGVIYALIAVASGAVFAIILAGTITRQLRLLMAGTRRLAEDRLDEPVPVVSDNETGVVARAFNEAMDKLRQQRTELVRAHDALEAEVAVRRRAEQELIAANRAITNANESLRQFAYAASHDLQEPLRSVSGYSELLRRRYTGRLDEDADVFIGFIHAGARRMENLIRALLEYSRAGAAGGEAAHEVATGEALGEAIANLEAAISNSGAVIATADLPPVRAHEVALVQLFQNLIGNAIKYAGSVTPRVEISAVRQDNFWLFSVRDYGVGIHPRDHERIFGIFKRAHGDEFPGTGVGLAICAKIVDRYGGRIWVESELGEGSTFFFTLPAVKKPAASPGPPLRKLA
jgi:signal transduction histidine kinase